MSSYQVLLKQGNWKGENGLRHIEQVVVPRLAASGFRAEILRVPDIGTAHVVLCDLYEMADGGGYSAEKQYETQVPDHRSLAVYAADASGTLLPGDPLYERNARTISGFEVTQLVELLKTLAPQLKIQQTIPEDL